MNHIGDVAPIMTALALLINAVITMMSYLRSRQNGVLLTAVKAQTDGINSRLVTVTGEAEHAKGMLQGAEEQRAKEI